jgi:hypothetical protein
MINEASFFPCHMTLLIKRVTNVSLNLGSGARGNFLALDFLIYKDFDVLILFFSFYALGTILGTALLAVFYTGSIQATPYDVVTYTRKILHTTTPYQNDGVFLKVMSFTWDVCDNLDFVGQTNFRNLPQC